MKYLRNNLHDVPLKLLHESSLGAEAVTEIYGRVELDLASLLLAGRGDLAEDYFPLRKCTTLT